MKAIFLLRLLIFVFCWITPTYGQNRVAQYLRTHKVLIWAEDAPVILGRSLAAASSVACQNAAPVRCVEVGGVGLGKHPSAGATWGFALASAGVMVAFNHLWWHWTRVDDEARGLRPLAGAWILPLFTFDVVTAHDNWGYADSLRHPEPVPHYRR